MRTTVRIQLKPDFWWIVTLMMTAVLILLVGGCTDTLDYTNYMRIYEGIYPSTGIEKGYVFLMELCKSHGFSYSLFRLIIIAACYLLISKIIYQLVGKKTVLIWILYLFSAMPFDAVNMRNTIVNTIFLYAFIEGLKGEKKNTILFVVLTIISAILFHKSALFFLVCVPAFIRVNNEKTIQYKRRDAYILFVIVIFFILALFPGLLSAVGNRIWLLLSALTNISSSKGIYFEVKGHLGFLLYTVCHMSFFMAILYVRNKISVYGNRFACLEEDDYKQRTHFIDVLFLCNILLIAFLPVVRINSELYRVIRSFQLLEYIAYFYGIVLLPPRSIDRMIANTFILFATVVNFIILILPYYDTIFTTLFTSNIYL